MRGLALLLIAAMTSAGCFNDGTGWHPTAFPNEGRSGGTLAENDDDWGTTVAMMIDSNYLPVADLDEWHDVHPGMIEIWIRDDLTGFEVQAHVRSVFDLEADSWSFLARFLQPGLWGTVVLFDLPPHYELDSVLGFGGASEETVYPRNVVVFAKVDGFERATAQPGAWRDTPFTLTGWGGAAQELMGSGWWAGEETWLQRSAYSVVRLRGKSSAFVAGQVIGSMEFDFVESTCDVDVIDARLRTEAKGIVMLEDPVSGSNRQRVTVISPLGFQLTHLDPNYTDENLEGQGPFLDLLITENFSCDTTAPGWFTIQDLTATDLHGVAIGTLDGLSSAEVDYPGAETETAILRAYLIDPTPTI